MASSVVHFDALAVGRLVQDSESAERKGCWAPGETGVLRHSPAKGSSPAGGGERSGGRGPAHLYGGQVFARSHARLLQGSLDSWTKGCTKDSLETVVKLGGTTAPWMLTHHSNAGG